jgi:branched-chain amino acid transport system permease protein
MPDVHSHDARDPLPGSSPAPLPDPFARPALPIWAANIGLLALLALLWPLAGLLNDNLNPYYFQILILIGINAIMATSLNLINGIAGQFSLGHAGFMGIGAYTAGVLFKHYANPDWSGGAVEGMVFLSVLLLGGALAALAGLIIGIPTLRLSGDYLAIATLGMGEIIVLIITNTESIRIGPGPSQVLEVGGASGLHGIPQPQSAHYFFWTFGWLVICVVTIWRMIQSIGGKGFLAVREDEIAASAVGINVTRQKVMAFTIGAFFAGVAGGLAAMWVQNLDPSGFGFMRSIDYVVMVVLGGSGSVTGALLAAAVLTYLPEQLRAVKDWRMVIYSLLLILTMLLRPEGLLGRRELWWTRKRLASAAGAGMAGSRSAAQVPAAQPPVE